MFPSLDTKILDMKCSRLYINSNVGKEIEKAMSEAEEFIYIISPYISEENIEFLKNLYRDKKLDIKLIFADKSNFFKQEKEVSKLKSFFKYTPKQDIDNKKIIFEQEKNTKFSKIKSSHFLFTGIFLFSLAAFIVLYFLKKITNVNAPILTLILLFSVYNIFSCNKKIKFLDYEMKRKIEEFKKNNIPNMESIEDIKIKFIQTSYCNKKITAPYPHLKIYLMDVPRISKTIGKTTIKAFVSSANFTKNGFNENLEFFVETTNFNVTKDLYKFFNEMFGENNFYVHQNSFILRKLFEFGIIRHKE